MSKRKSQELDVDFIGGLSPLTKEEEKAISDYIKAQKLLKAKKLISRTGLSSRLSASKEGKKVIA